MTRLTSGARRSSALLNVERLEDRCTPATAAYVADSQTLTVTGANNLQLTVAAIGNAPSGYITVQEQDHPTLFNSDTGARPVRNLIIRFDAVDNGDLTVTAAVRLGGNFSVFGTLLAQRDSLRPRCG